MPYDEAGLGDIYNIIEEKFDKLLRDGIESHSYKTEGQNEKIIKLLQEIKAILEKPKD